MVLWRNSQYVAQLNGGREGGEGERDGRGVMEGGRERGKISQGSWTRRQAITYTCVGAKSVTIQSK